MNRIRLQNKLDKCEREVSQLRSKLGAQEEFLNSNREQQQQYESNTSRGNGNNREQNRIANYMKRQKELEAVNEYGQEMGDEYGDEQDVQNNQVV